MYVVGGVYIVVCKFVNEFVVKNFVGWCVYDNLFEKFGRCLCFFKFISEFGWWRKIILVLLCMGV